MKYRNSFVTNSSSSSFIGVFAKVKNRNKAAGIIKKYNLQNNVFCTSKILSGYFNVNDFNHDWCNVSLVDEQKLQEIKTKSQWDDLFVLWESYGDFSPYEYISDGWEEPNYDCDFSDFSEKSKDIMNAICSENGFEIIGSGYGAGYNG